MKCLYWFLAVGLLWNAVLMPGFAETTLDAHARGWYDETGFNEMINPNYFVGDGRGPIGGSSLAEARNFFVFDLSTVAEPIENASLSLYVPPVVGYFSGDPSETYVVSEVEFDADTVINAGDFLPVYEDLADGTVYATRDFVSSDVGVQVEIPLNAAAITALNERRVNTFDPFFVFGGSISTLNDFFDDEYIFAFSSEVPMSETRLVINASTLVGPDFNSDSLLDCADVDALTGEIAGETHAAAYDLTGDGLVNVDDLDSWLSQAGAVNLPSGASYLYGDANLDGSVDVSDFNIWNENKFTTNTDWCSADFNADGSIDVSDFNAWNENKFTSADAQGVPEPGSGLLLLGCLMGMAGVLRSEFANRRGNC